MRHGKLKPVDWGSAAEHWPFRKIAEHVQLEYDETDRDRVKNPIDQFVLRKLRDSGFTPTGPAGKRTRICRAMFDLIGLPPTVDEVHDCLNADSPRAFARVVERLTDRYGGRAFRLTDVEGRVVDAVLSLSPMPPNDQTHSHCKAAVKRT